MNKPFNLNFCKIVALLADGEFHDGDSLGKALHATRAAVWKIIKKLQSYDVAIESVKGKGYRLLEPLVLLDLNKIQHSQALNAFLFESMSSTSEFLKTCKNNKVITVCLAERQTQGKGRFDRSWHSPFGKNIYFSCLYPFQKDISELAGLSLVVGLAVVKTLNAYSCDKPFLMKWPNDVVYDGKKICGILVEMAAESHALSSAIIGIGMNVNMTELKVATSYPWSSLKNTLGSYVDRNELCSLLLKNLFNYLEEFSKTGLTSFISEWKKADGLLHQDITVSHIQQNVSGKMMGINSQGHLLLQHANGEVKAYSSGDTSLRGWGDR